MFLSSPVCGDSLFFLRGPNEKPTQPNASSPSKQTPWCLFYHHDGFSVCIGYYLWFYMIPQRSCYPNSSVRPDRFSIFIYLFSYFFFPFSFLSFFVLFCFSFYLFSLFFLFELNSVFQQSVLEGSKDLYKTRFDDVTCPYGGCSEPSPGATLWSNCLPIE